MNILRLIKLKKVLGELDNLTPEEELFFQLHDNLHYENDLLCSCNGEWLFDYDLDNKIIWCQFERVYLVFETKFNISYIDFKKIIGGILKKRLNLKEVSIFSYNWFDS